MLRIKRHTMLALMGFNFAFWFSIAFASLQIFPMLMFIVSASILAYEVSSNGK